MFLSGLFFRRQLMELITRVLAGVIAAWIPMDGEGRRRSPDNALAESFVESPLPINRTIAILKSGGEYQRSPS
jgi:hypothetical protein